MAFLQVRRLSEAEQAVTPLRQKSRQFVSRNIELSARNRQLQVQTKSEIKDKTDIENPVEYRLVGFTSFSVCVSVCVCVCVSTFVTSFFSFSPPKHFFSFPPYRATFWSATLPWRSKVTVRGWRRDGEIAKVRLAWWNRVKIQIPPKYSKNMGSLGWKSLSAYVLRAPLLMVLKKNSYVR